jgi:cytochrome-b5 reductase
MLQVIREIITNPDDKTEVHLIYANHEERDILVKSTLDSIATQYPNIHVTYVVSQPSSAWTGAGGRINLELLTKTMPAPAEDVSVYVCGPPSFVKDICGEKTPDYKQGPVGGYLKDIGFDENMVFKF